MAMWGAVFLLAVAGTTVLAEPSLTFPEIARGPSRIVSGWEAQVGQLPHQLSLRMVSPAGGVSSCGGTIIHAEWGLTAAHCSAGRVTLVIRAGTVNLTQPSAIFETCKYYNHPQYNEAIPGVVQPNDIGVIKFGRKLEFSYTIQPIRLQRSEASNKNYAEVRLIASGWGRTWTNGASPENLNWVYLSGVSNAACLAAFGGSSIIQPSTICAKSYNVSSQSTCQGDSGGPLTVIDVDGGLTQIGVTSFVSGTGCHTDYPAGFVRPGPYHDWFLEVTGIDFDWVPSDESGEGSPEQSGEGSPEQSGEGSPEQSGEGSPEQSGEGSPEQSGEGSPEQSGEGSPEQSGEGSPEQSGEGSPEQSGEGSPEQSVESSPESEEGSSQASSESDQSNGSSKSSSESSD